jgi:hypothetical protein
LFNEREAQSVGEQLVGHNKQKSGLINTVIEYYVAERKQMKL